MLGMITSNFLFNWESNSTDYQIKIFYWTFLVAKPKTHSQIVVGFEYANNQIALLTIIRRILMVLLPIKISPSPSSTENGEITKTLISELATLQTPFTGNF